MRPALFFASGRRDFPYALEDLGFKTAMEFDRLVGDHEHPPDSTIVSPLTPKEGISLIDLRHEFYRSMELWRVHWRHGGSSLPRLHRVLSTLYSSLVKLRWLPTDTDLKRAQEAVDDLHRTLSHRKDPFRDLDPLILRSLTEWSSLTSTVTAPPQIVDILAP